MLGKALIMYVSSNYKTYESMDEVCFTQLVYLKPWTLSHHIITKYSKVTT